VDLKGWISELGGVHEGYFSRNYYILRNENFEKNRQRYIDECHNTDVYQCAYHYEDDDIDHCRIIGSPYLDFDMDNIETPENWKRLVHEVKYVINYVESSMNVPLEEIEIYFSGSKGFHIIIPHEILGIEPETNLNETFKYFALGMAYIINGKKVSAAKKDSIDIKIYDRKRLFRIPNSINSKSGKYKVPISIDQLYQFSYSDIMEWASKPRILNNIELPSYSAIAAEGFQAIVDAGMDYECLRDGRTRRRKRKRGPLPEGVRLELLPCTQKLLTEGIAKGFRNHSCFALASSLRQSGYTEEETLGIIQEWNDSLDEPLASGEILITVNSANNSYESGMTVGCGKYHELNLCVEGCKLLEN